jgi:hypothetical protein
MLVRPALNVERVSSSKTVVLSIRLHSVTMHKTMRMLLRDLMLHGSGNLGYGPLGHDIM